MTSKQNGGYRTPSGKSRNRSRTKSYDSDDDYSDSFESETTEVDWKKSGTSSKTVTKKKPTGTGTTTTSNGKPANSRAKNIKPSPKGKGLKNGRGSVPVASPRDMDVVSKRMLSARRLKINELRNQVEELNLLVQDLKLENRTMKRDFRRQDKALSRYEVQESELPSLIAQHGEEVRTLRDQIKRTKEKYENSNKRYKDLSDELQRTKKLLKQYKELAENKKLGERDELAQKLMKTEAEMDEKDKKIRDLERYIDNLQKNQRHELAIEIHRHRETQRRVAKYEDMIQGLETQIKEKEKILDIKNIYSNRIVRPPHKLPSGASTPLSLKHSKRSSLSDHRMTPRDKMKLYEEKRREDDKKQREQTPRTVSAISTQTTPPPPAKTQEELNSRSTTPSPPSVKAESDGDDSECERRKSELIKRNQEYSSHNSIGHDEVKEEAGDSAEWQYRKDKERWDAEEEKKRRKAAELDEARRRDREMQEAKDRERLEERERLARERTEDEMRRRRERENEERREREERDRREREERERREREDRERVEEERRYKGDRERREREERARREEERAQEERERMEKDTQFQEERRKKDALLAKLRALDEIDNDHQNNLYKQHKPTEKIQSGSNISASSSKKSYSFTKPIENLHQGKPSHEDITVPYVEKRRRSGFMDDDVPYQPSFDDSHAGNQQAKKKADLMKNLFGDSAVTTMSKKTEPTKRAVDRPDVEDLDGGNEFFVTKSNRRPSTDADLAFTFSSSGRGRNENGSSDSKLLPRRQTQQSTVITKPTVSLIDDPDDLEEVIL